MRIPPVFDKGRLRLCMRLISNGLGQALTAISSAVLVKIGFDHLVALPAAGISPVFVWIGLGLLTTAACTAGLRTWERIDAERMGQDYVHQTRLVLFQRLTSLSPRALQQRSRGGVMLRFVSDLSALRQWVSLGLARLIVVGITTLGALLALALIHLSLAGALASVLGFGTLLSVRLDQRLQHSFS